MLSLVLLGFLAIPVLRLRLYEASLRTHQLLAVGVIYALLRHIHRSKTTVWYCVAAYGGALAAGTLISILSAFVRDRAYVRGCARATVSRVNNVVVIDIATPTRVVVHSGQYINLWMPGLSTRSWFQIHPFFVLATHDDQGGSQLKLVVIPRRGWTAHLYRRTLDLDRSRGTYMAFFTGPHGIPIPVADYSVVILAASGSGVTAQLSFMQHLISEYDNGVARTRRIRVVWQLDHLGKISSASMSRLW